MNKRHVWYLRKHAALARLPDAALSALADVAELQEHRPRKTLYLPGDHAEHVFFLHGGRVSTFYVAPSGRTITLGLHGPAEVFGESCLWTAAPRDAMATTATAALLSVVPRAQLRELLDEHPPAERALAMQAIGHRDAAALRLCAVASASVRARLAQQLLELGERGRDTADGIELPSTLRHHEFAALIGATRETVSIELGKLEREQVIHRRGRLILLADPARLRLVASDPFDRRVSKAVDP